MPNNALKRTQTSCAQTHDPGDLMSEQENIIRAQGVIRARRYDPAGHGKQFLGACIECRDGDGWILGYSEQSPYHAFADRQVVVSGEPYEPNGQRVIIPGIAWRHLRVSSMWLMEVMPDARLVEIGAETELSGRFKRGISPTGELTLSFVTESGDTFLVANHPARMTKGRRVEVSAFPVRLARSIATRFDRYLWIIPPHSMANSWTWRKGRVYPRPWWRFW
jgi:hypothetical protein